VSEASHRSTVPIVPPATIGMLGGGQLGGYALVAARSMGYRTLLLEPDAVAPAGRIADEHLVAPYDDTAALRRMGIDCDVVTTEFENPPAAALDVLAAATRVAPAPSSVAIAQDRRAEKAFLIDQGAPVGPYVVVDADSGATSLRGLRFPAVLKTARLGYDGKGQRRVSSPSELHAAWAELGGAPCVAEELLTLSAEISVVIARTADARTATYPVAENVHVGGILDLTVVPARVPDIVADRATGLALAIADALDYVGVLAVELFVVGDDLYVNELAPRPHNSGHWTLDAARTSQFEQQIRAVCALALGDTASTVPAVAMVNLLGDLWAGGPPQWAAALTETGTHLHLYGKAAARPGRKMGHLTVTGRNANEVAARAVSLRDAVARRR
jgi:5-(carboxyamino)imidazole ribonucleotide synthase